MSYYQLVKEYEEYDFDGFFQSRSEDDVLAVIDKERLSTEDYLTLLSPAAGACLEEMARKAQEVTWCHFGKSISLYTPLYLANYCENHCLYCSFSAKQHLSRKKLSPEEIKAEAEAIAGQGFQDLLILTGESHAQTPVEYIAESCGILREYFPALGIEVYPLTVAEYEMVVAAGADYLTMYQEVYREEAYLSLHPAGPKRDYRFRLEAPERAAAAGFRSVSVGALLGLADWRRESFFTGLHVQYLNKHYPGVETGLSTPRIRPNLGGFQPRVRVTDADLVQIIMAHRLFLPRTGISLSTREPAGLRDHLLGLGVTRISAGSVTAVGGHAAAAEAEAEQFVPDDHRSVSQVKAAIIASGHQPVFKDWHRLW